MSETEVQLRQQNPEESDKMAQFESPEGEAICASYVSRAVADDLGEYAQVTISDEDGVTAELDNVSGSGDGNYGIYETAKGAVTGLYVSHDTLAELHDGEASPENAPESIGLSFSQSDEESFEEAIEEQEEQAEEEAEALLADSDGDDSDEDEIEIDDEELELVE